MRPLAAALLLWAAPAAAQTAAPTPLSADEVELDRLSEFAAALRAERFLIEPAEEGRARAWLIHYGAPEQPQWHVMSLTESQWNRWQRKAKAWKEDRQLRKMYRDDEQDYMGGLGGNQIAAIVDALIVHIHNISPNDTTRFLMDGMWVYERVTREIPREWGIELRDDTRAYLSDALRRYGPDLSQAEDLDLENGTPRPDHDSPTTLKRLTPKLRVKLNPRAQLPPSLHVGVSAEWERLHDNVGFKVVVDYDSKDNDGSAAGMFDVHGSGRKPEPIPEGPEDDPAEFEHAVAVFKRSRGYRYELGPIEKAEALLKAYVKKRPEGLKAAEAKAMLAEIDEGLAAQDLRVARQYMDELEKPNSALVYVESILRERRHTAAGRQAVELLREIAEQDEDPRARDRARERLTEATRAPLRPPA